MQCESEGIIRRQIVKLITALFVYNELRYVTLHLYYNRYNLFSVDYIILRYKMNVISLFPTLFIEFSIVMTNVRH